MAEGTGASTEHSLLSDHQLARRVVPLSIGSDMLGSGASSRPQDPDDRTRSGPCEHSYHHQAPAVPKPGSPAPAPLEPLPFGFRTPRRFPLGVSRALVLLGLALHSPLPCLQNLFLLIHLSRYRLSAHHLCSLSGHGVRVVRRQSGPGLASKTVQAWKPSGLIRQRTRR